MNTYKSKRHAKFLLNYHFIWIPKYRHFPKLNIKGSVWTRAYFAATAGNVSSETIQHYIENQR